MTDLSHQFASPMSTPTGPAPDSTNAVPSTPGSVETNGITGLNHIILSNPKPPRSRRRSLPGQELVKHRRTRSGCFTCRSRRVKCDEGRPTCERCRKGKRECVYPTLNSTKGGKSDSQLCRQSSGEGDDDEVDENELESIPDEDGEGLDGAKGIVSTLRFGQRRASTASTLSLRRIPSVSVRPGSQTPSLEGVKSSSPSFSQHTSSEGPTPAHFGFIEPPPPTPTFRPEWTNLSPDFQHYLCYYIENVTFYHYGAMQDPDNFFKTTLIDLALRDKALLYAVVGFSAYFCTLRNPSGKIEDFLTYYNQSVSFLLSSLQGNQQSIATLLTILQLATIEEYLGDWVLLLGHRRAAMQILSSMYSPESIVQTSINRMIFTWYVRLEVSASLTGGVASNLPRDWYLVFAEYCEARVKSQPESLNWKTEAALSQLRLISADMTTLTEQRSREEINVETFLFGHETFQQHLQHWKNTLDPALVDVRMLVSSTPLDMRRQRTDFVPGDPLLLAPLYDQPLFSTTLLTCEWHATVLMHSSAAFLVSQTQPTPEGSIELEQHARGICGILETMEHWQQTPKGAIALMQPYLAIASLFLPKTPEHHMWTRRKFALLETLGYIFPRPLRLKMADVFNDKSCVEWWLPNGEMLTPILVSVRAFADDRNRAGEATQDMWEMKHVLAALELAEASTPVDARSGAFWG